MDQQLVETLLNEQDEFMGPLRVLDGFNPEAYQRYCSALKAFAREWRDQDLIPKVVASALVDVYPAMLSIINVYQENEKDTVERAAEELAVLIRDCFV